MGLAFMVTTLNQTQAAYQEILEKKARRFTYWEDEHLSLELFLFYPEGAVSEERLPVVLFVPGDGWNGGLPSQYVPQCLQFSEMGMVAGGLEFRSKSFQTHRPFDALLDTRAAFRWVREYAEDLGIDGERIVGAGSSEGGYLALHAGISSEKALFLGEEREGLVSCVPNALLLWEPVIALQEALGFSGSGEERLGKAELASLDLMRRVRKGLPPTLIFHGTLDRVLSVEHARRFIKKMQRKKNHCRLVEYGGSDHGFYHFNVNPELFQATMDEAKRFLREEEFVV